MFGLKRFIAGATSAAMALSMLGIVPAEAGNSYGLSENVYLTPDSNNSLSYMQTIVDYGTSCKDFVDDCWKITVTADITNWDTNTGLEPKSIYGKFFLMDDSWENWSDKGAMFDENGHLEFTCTAKELADISLPNGENVGKAGFQLNVLNNNGVATEFSEGDYAAFDLEYDVSFEKNPDKRDQTLTVVENPWSDGFSATKEIDLYNNDYDIDEFVRENGIFTVSADISDLISETGISPEDISLYYYVMGNKNWNWVSVGGKFDKNGHVEFSGKAMDLIDQSFKEDDTAIGRAGLQLSIENADDYKLGDNVSFNFSYNIETAKDPDQRDVNIKVTNNPYGDGFAANYMKDLVSYESKETFADTYGDFTITADISDLTSPSGIKAENIVISFFLMGDQRWNWASVSAPFDENGHAVLTGNAYELIDQSFGLNDTCIGRAGIELAVKDPDSYKLGDKVSFNFEWSGEYKEAENPNIFQSGDYTYLREKTFELENDFETGEEKIVTKYTADIKSYSGKGGDLEIPNEIDGYPVVAIDENAFAELDTLTSVVIPETVVNIRTTAFKGCKNLSSVTLPDSGCQIFYGAFSDCTALKEITIPRNTGLDGYSIGFNFKTVIDDWGYEYFENEKRDDFVINCYYDTAGYNYAKENDLKYNVIDLKESGDFSYLVQDYSYFSYSDEHGEEYLTKQVAKIIAYDGKGGELTIPKTLDGYEVYFIGSSAFMGNGNITAVTIPDTVVGIETEAFANCNNLSEVKLPDNFLSIGYKAFFNCTGLKEVTINKNISLDTYDMPFGYYQVTEEDEYGNVDYYEDKDEEFKIYCYYESNGYYYARESGFDYEAVDINKCGDFEYVLFDDYQYVYDEDTGEEKEIISKAARMINYTGEGGDVIIPAELDGYEVKDITEAAFKNNTSLTGITIPKTLDHINENSFWGCLNLSSVTLPERYIYIGNYAFFNCPALKKVTIDESANLSVDGCAFGYVCFDEDQDYMDSKTKVEGFKIYCYFNSEGKRYAESNGFDYELLDVKYCGDFMYSTYEYDDEETGETVVNAEIIGYTGKGGDITIPAELDGIKVSSVYSGFKNNPDITSVTISDGIRFIAGSAFSGCKNLAEINIPESVIIDTCAFLNCPALKEVTVGRNCWLSKRDYAFGFESDVITDEWGNELYNNFRKAKDFTINCYFGSDAYYYAKENGFDMNILDAYTCGDYLYMIETVESYNYDDEIETEKEITLKYARIVDYYGEGGDIVIPEKLDEYEVRSIASDTFRNNKTITGAVIPDTVESIGYNAFEGCSALTDVTLPNGYTEIFDDAFLNCPQLKEITVNKDNYVYKYGMTFGYMLKGNENEESGEDEPEYVKIDGFTLYCYSDSSAYSFADYHGLNYVLLDVVESGDYLYSVNDDDSATVIGYTGTEKDLTVPEKIDGHKVTRIGSKAFAGNTDIESVNIPEGVISIGEMAFYGCSSLKSLTVPKSVESIENESIGYEYSEESERNEIVDGIKLYGYKGTNAETYAKENNIEFIALDEDEFILGDLNDDGKVNMRDYVKMQRYLLDSKVQINFKAADFNGDGKINMLDYVKFQRYLLK